MLASIGWRIYGDFTRRMILGFVGLGLALGLLVQCGRMRRARRRNRPPASHIRLSTTTSASGAISRNFCDLFLKNHYPLLKKIESTGRILSVKVESPAYHTTEDGRWDYRVTIRLQELDGGHEREPG